MPNAGFRKKKFLQKDSISLHFFNFNKKGLAIWRSEFSSSKIKITNTAKSIGLYIFFLTIEKQERRD